MINKISLIPVLDNAIQPSRDYFTSLLRMPLRARNRTFACADLVQHLRALPIVETYKPTRVPCHHELAIGTHAHIDGVPSTVVTPEDFFAVLAEAVGTGVNNNLVIGGLEGDGFVRRVR